MDFECVDQRSTAQVALRLKGDHFLEKKHFENWIENCRGDSTCVDDQSGHRFPVQSQMVPARYGRSELGHHRSGRNPTRRCANYWRYLPIQRARSLKNAKGEIFSSTSQVYVFLSSEANGLHCAGSSICLILAIYNETFCRDLGQSIENRVFYKRWCEI
ncbi:hypothetical protein COB52_04230 [Candidatus Kaiserbacteria bacterium]|nr:MAG: hypothetical protein COB52_04230 [Candidatus Kaiserbacteria bacterium]